MDDAMIKRMVQVGVVSAIQGNTARVIFRESGMTSAFLPVLQHNDAVVTMEPAGGPEDPQHTHVAKVTTWMPKVNDVVLVIYPPIQNSDGYIIGRIP